jgi:DNA polymerase III alpha subunit
MLIKKNTEDELIQGVIKHGTKILENCVYQEFPSLYFETINNEKLDYYKPQAEIDVNDWLIPSYYKNLNIEDFCISLCQTDEEKTRVRLEFDLFKKHDMIMVIKTMKFIVDTLRENNVLWGVGRGSSVASYSLYLIGVHKIDSIKYKLPIEEFIRGE